jgi:hypothetical protein
MMREFNMEEKDNYKGLCKKEQEEFRVAWARTQLTGLVEIKRHLKEYQKIDTSVGEYMSAARVFNMEGGTQEDIAPTHRLLRKKKCPWDGPMSSTTKRQSDMTSSMSADEVQKASRSAGSPTKRGIRRKMIWVRTTLANRK